MRFPDVYPWADQVHTAVFHSEGPFTVGPRGVTIHYTADPKLDRCVRVLVERRLGYHLLIDRAGKVLQHAGLRQRLWHAGRAHWKGLSPNQDHVAIAFLGWGELERRGADVVAWNGDVVPAADVVERRGSIWEAATAAQEVSLRAVCAWLVKQGIRPENICGHDECALPAGRKVDPGGSLSFTMAALRSELGAV